MKYEARKYHKANDQSLKKKITLYEIVADHAPNWNISTNDNYARSLCPFGNPQDKKHSFSVSKRLSIFYCNICVIGGDSITYIMHLKKLSYEQACHYLADKYVETHVY